MKIKNPRYWMERQDEPLLPVKKKTKPKRFEPEEVKSVKSKEKKWKTR
jgi:hypothetical protein